MPDTEPEEMTRKEWEELHPDFKAVDEEGQRFALRLEKDTGATVLVPVRVTEGGK